VLAWNGAIKLLGAQNASLFGNLIPVTTFAIEIARGYRPGVAALAGAAVTVAALIANNLIARRPARVTEPLTHRTARNIELEPA
jgi:drug/metabolite transporter (DMT)-like permease